MIITILLLPLGHISFSWSFFIGCNEELGYGRSGHAFSNFVDLYSVGSSSGVCMKSQTLDVVDVYVG
jgi:hypothetical protein